MNHYEILEISSDAMPAQIKSAYRKLVKRYHPDINPDPAAASKMILINEAYEVLSEPATRTLYDLYLQGVPVKTVIEETTPEQKYRAEYIRNKIRKEREQMERLFRVKQRFYCRFRVANMLFFGFSVLLTFDYYYSFNESTFMVDDVLQGTYETYIVITNGSKIATNRSFYYDYWESNSLDVAIRFTSILQRPQKVRAENSDNAYFIHGTIYSFRNAFSVIMLFFSMIVVANKRYTDFRLSSGLLAAMCCLYILLMLTTG